MNDVVPSRHVPAMRMRSSMWLVSLCVLGCGTTESLPDGGSLRDAAADAARRDAAAAAVDAGDGGMESPDAAQDAASADAAIQDAATADAAAMGCASDAGGTGIVAGETCIYGIDPHPCDGNGYWQCDAGPTPMIGTTRGTYRYAACACTQECVERTAGAPPVVGACMAVGRECDLLDPPYCGADGLVRYCASGHWTADDTCGSTGSPYRCAAPAGSPTSWRCVDAPLVACDPATYTNHCDGSATAVECEPVTGYVVTIPCTATNPACFVGLGHAACALSGASACDPSAPSFACSAGDPDVVLGCAPSGHRRFELRCLRTTEMSSRDCECTASPPPPAVTAGNYCQPGSGPPAGAGCATTTMM